MIIQQITLIIASMRRNRFNQLDDDEGFGVERISNVDRIQRPLRIFTVWKCSNNDPGGIGGGRIVNNGGGGSNRRCKLAFFI